MAIICGTDCETECGKRRVHTVMMIRYFRRRLGGDILRAHPDDINRGELIQHAELVRRGELPREGSLVYALRKQQLLRCLEQRRVAHHVRFRIHVQERDREHERALLRGPTAVCCML